MTHLEFHRRRLGFSIWDLYSLTGVPVGDISRLENGRLIPTQRQLDKLAAGLAVAPDFLLREARLAPEPEELEAAR